MELETQYLNILIQKLENEMESSFENYLEIVNYKGGRKQYMIDKSSNLNQLVDKYFNSLLNLDRSDANSKIDEVKYELATLTRQYQDYKMTTQQGLAYYQKFELMIGSLDISCGSKQIPLSIVNNRTVVQTRIANAKLKFENAYIDAIPLRIIRELIIE